jgi:hypothetical protein
MRNNRLAEIRDEAFQVRIADFMADVLVSSVVETRAKKTAGKNFRP